jgi:hypothetical protein
MSITCRGVSIFCRRSRNTSSFDEVNACLLIDKNGPQPPITPRSVLFYAITRNARKIGLCVQSPDHTVQSSVVSRQSSAHDDSFIQRGDVSQSQSESSSCTATEHDAIFCVKF